MKQTTQWKPDTCSCKLEYEWEDSVPQNERVHTLKVIHASCDAHKALVDKTQRFDTVQEENQRKNKAIDEIIQNSPELAEEVEDNEGNPHKELKKGKSIDFSFDEDRKLHLEIKGEILSTAKKNSLKTKIDSRVGNDKVIID